MRTNIIGAAVAVNSLLTAALAFLWSEPARSGWSEPAAVPPALDEVVATAAPQPVDVSIYRETIDRPLFSMNRRPAPRAEPDQVAEAVDPLRDVRVVGLYAADGRGGAVVVSGGKVQRMAYGEKIGQWQLAGQDGRRAALTSANGEQRHLELALNTTAPATAPSSTAKAEAKAPAEASAGATAGQAARRTGRPEPDATARTTRGRAGADGGGAGAPDAAARESELQQRLARINARRAQRGLPPLKE
jgi:hypothetical protein